MSSQASCCTEGVGRFFIYGAYNLGLGIAVGLVRTAIATAYIAKHAFYAGTFQKHYEDLREARQSDLSRNRSDRAHENRTADRDTERATGIAKAWSWAKGKVVKAKNGMAGLVDEGLNLAEGAVLQGANDFVQTVEAERAKAWKGELGRGLSEIFYFGAPYHTYQDNFSKEHKVSVFGLDELCALMNKEATDDKAIQDILGRDLYDPWY